MKLGKGLFFSCLWFGFVVNPKCGEIRSLQYRSAIYPKNGDFPTRLKTKNALHHFRRAFSALGANLQDHFERIREAIFFSPSTMGVDLYPIPILSIPMSMSSRKCSLAMGRDEGLCRQSCSRSLCPLGYIF